MNTLGPFGKLLADAGVFVLVQLVVLFIQQMGDEHQCAGQDRDKQQQAQGLAVLYAAENSGDGAELFRLGDGAGGGRRLQRGDLVGVIRHPEDHVACGGDDHRQGGGQLGQEGPEGGDNGLVSCAVDILVILHCIDDGDHHNQVEAVLAKVRGHVADNDDPELEHGGAGGQTGNEHQRVANGGNQHHDIHQLFPGDAAGDGRIEDHQKGGGGHAHGGENGEQAALIAKGKVDVGASDAGKDDAVSDLLNKENQGDPQKLVVAGDGADDLFKADGRSAFLAVISLLADAENGKAQKERGQQADHKSDAPIGNICASADGHAAGGEHGDQHTGRGAADAGKKGRTGGKLVSCVSVGAQGRHHAPIGDVVHGVGNAEQEIGNAEKPDKAPALELRVEQSVDHHGGRQYADDQPGLEFAPFGAGALNDVAHDGVVQRVKYPGAHHDGRDSGELGGIQPTGKENE